MIKIIIYHYLILNGLLVLGFILSKYVVCCAYSKKITSYNQQLKISRYLLLYIPGIYLLMLFIKSYFFPEKIFLFHLGIGVPKLADDTYRTVLGIPKINGMGAIEYFYILLIAIILTIIIIKITSYIVQLIKLQKIIQDSILIRKQGNLRLFVADSIRSPFCFSWFNHTNIVLMSQLLENGGHFQVALKHELQHIRQNDTLWIYIFSLFKVLFFLNPCVHLWVNNNLELQELSCDEILINEKLIPAHEYAQCLLAVMECVKNKEYYSVTVSLFQSQSSTIKRRITMLYQYKKSSYKKYFFLVLLINALFSGAIATTAYALGSTEISANSTELDKPVFSDNKIKSWSKEAINKAFNYDYTNYKTNLESASKYFTQTGWKGFMTALTESGNIEAVVRDKLTLSSVINADPEILNEGVNDGKFSWRVKVPVRIAYKNESKEVVNDSMVTLVIVRTADTVNGIGVNEIYIAENK